MELRQKLGRSVYLLQAFLVVRSAGFCVVIKVVFRVLGPEVNLTQRQTPHLQRWRTVSTKAPNFNTSNMSPIVTRTIHLSFLVSQTQILQSIENCPRTCRPGDEINFFFNMMGLRYRQKEDEALRTKVGKQAWLSGGWAESGQSCKTVGVEEASQQLKAAFVEDPGLVTSSHTAAHNCL